MKQTYKRILTRALALSLTLCLSVQLLPLAVLAEEGQSAPAEELTELLPEVPQEAGSIPSEPQPEQETPAAEPAPEEEPAEDPEEGLTPEEPSFEGLPVVMVEPVEEEPLVEEESPAVLLAESTNTRTEDYYWEDQWFGTFTTSSSMPSTSMRRPPMRCTFLIPSAASR